MRILAVIQHTHADTGVFADEAASWNHELDEWIAMEGPPPRPLSEYGAVMAFGGPTQADEDERHPWLRSVSDVLGEAVERDVPLLGICLGGQMLARATGGTVGPAERAEWAWNEVELTDAGLQDPLFVGRARTLDVFQSHSYAFTLPPDAVPLARNAACLQAFRIGERAWGLQWHPEVTADAALAWGRAGAAAAHGDPDLTELEAAVAARMARTNDEGRELCRRFLRVAEAAR